MSKRLYCPLASNSTIPHPQASWLGYHPDIIKQLPPHAQEVPFVLYQRSAVDKRALWLFNSMIDYGIGPDSLEKIAREMISKEYDTKRKAWVEAGLWHQNRLVEEPLKPQHRSLFIASNFPPNDHPDSRIRPSPSAKAIHARGMNNAHAITDAVRQMMSCLSCSQLHIDDSFKAVLRSIQEDGEVLLSALTSATNEHNEIRVCATKLGKSVVHIEESLKTLVSSLESRGFSPVESAWVDDVKGQLLVLERCIPSLRNGVVRAIEGNRENLPLASLPEHVEVRYTQSYQEMDLLCSLLLANQTKQVGLDCEWQTPFTRVNLLQIASDQLVLVYQIPLNSTSLPPNLVHLLQLGADTLVKTGVGIRGDLTLLERDFPELQVDGWIDIRELARSTEMITEGESATLQALYAKAKSQHVPKVDLIRRSDWSSELSAEQIDYAAKDAFFSLELYDLLVKKAHFGQALQKDTDYPGQPVSIHLKGKPVVAFGRVVDPEQCKEHTIILNTHRVNAKITTTRCLVEITHLLGSADLEIRNYREGFRLKEYLSTRELPIQLVLNKSCLFTRNELPDSGTPADQSQGAPAESTAPPHLNHAEREQALVEETSGSMHPDSGNQLSYQSPHGFSNVSSGMAVDGDSQTAEPASCV